MGGVSGAGRRVTVAAKASHPERSEGSPLLDSRCRAFLDRDSSPTAQNDGGRQGQAQNDGGRQGKSS